MERVIFKCEKCSQEFPLSVGYLRSTADVPHEEIERRDGKKASEFVEKIMTHMLGAGVGSIKCDGVVRFSSCANVD
jgi:hypothetical protein